jgi:predicted phosphodiesterase
MRYGIVSDIHGNLPALRAALTALQRSGVDRLVCSGDIVGYGPQPNECVELVERLGMLSVAGNHDLIALGELTDAGCDRLARDTLRWTRDILDESARRYLASLPRVAELAGGVVVAHGSLDDPQEYVLDSEGAAAQLDMLRRRHPAAWALVLGHTHRALASDGRVALRGLREGRTVALGGERSWVLNPGAVGQSRQASIRSRFMVLDVQRREALFRASLYDVRAARRQLKLSGLAPGALHAPPWRPRAVVRSARRAAHRMRTVASQGRRDRWQRRAA